MSTLNSIIYVTKKEPFVVGGFKKVVQPYDGIAFSERTIAGFLQ